MESPSPPTSVAQPGGAPKTEPQASGPMTGGDQTPQMQQQAKQLQMQQQAQHAAQQAEQHQLQLQQQQQQQQQQQLAQQQQAQQLAHQQQSQQAQQTAQRQQQQLPPQQAQQQIWNAWQQQPPQQQYLFRTSSTDVEVRHNPQQQAQDAPDVQGGGLPVEVHAALQGAQRQAEAFIVRAAKLAALGGIDYAPPGGVPMQLPPLRKADAEVLQHQLAQVNAQRSQMAQHAMQLQSAMAQLHSSPPLLNGTAGGGGGGSGSPSDSLHTYSGGVSKPAKPPTGQPKRGLGQGRERRAASLKAAEMRQEWLQAEQQPLEAASPPAPSRTPSIQGRGQHPQSGSAPQGQRAAKQQEADEAEAWDTAPDDKLRLKLKDIKAGLQNKWLQVYWPDDKRWWPGQVASINVPKRRVVLLYETNEEEELDLADLIGKGEVAWLHKEDAPSQPQRPPPKPPRRQDSPPLAGLDDLPSSGDLGGLMDGDIFGGPLGGGPFMPQQHTAPYGHMAGHVAGGMGQQMGQPMLHGGQNMHGGIGGMPAGGGGGGMHPGSGVGPGGPPADMAAILSLGQGAIGSLAHIFWAERRSWFAARVMDCSPQQGSILVQYEGGRQDVLKAANENVEFRIRLLPPRPSMPTG